MWDILLSLTYSRWCLRIESGEDDPFGSSVDGAIPGLAWGYKSIQRLIMPSARYNFKNGFD